MSYERGMIHVEGMECSWDSCCSHYKHDKVGTSPVNGVQIWLPHSCDEWEIGGVSECEAMIEDLRAAIRHLTGKSEDGSSKSSGYYPTEGRPPSDADAALPRPEGHMLLRLARALGVL